ncbi:MAG TPA: ATP-binding protein, partial [Verrucomicrobiae bacterium]|nr:ATP-binding protein [Verrucomicrobiae bacterium]
LAGLPLDFPRPEQFDREHLRVTTDKLSQKVMELETVTLRLGRVIEIGRELASEHDADRLIDNVSRSARKVVGATLAGVGIINDDGRKLLQYNYYGMSAEKSVALTAPAVDQGVIHTILTEGRPVRLRNLDGSPEDLGLPADHPPIYSFLGVPIASFPRLYGWLALKNKIGRDEFTAEDESLAVSLAAQMAVAYENIQRYNEIQSHAENLEQQVDERTADLKRSNAELEQFAYVASHDLQEPLRKILGFTDLLAEKLKNQLDDDAKEYMSYVTGAASRMRELIQDLLTYSRAGKQSRKVERVDCQAVLSRVLLDLQPATEEHAAIVTNDRLPILSSDATQLGQLFQNLIGNAIKYRSDQPPRIHIGAEQINESQVPSSKFQVEESEKSAISNPQSAIANSPVWLFSVRDNGIGIEAKYSERIFRVFQRLHTRAQYPGTGIGLAICKKIVEGCGGRIWLESAAGQGSTFYFTLPAAQTDETLEPT